MPVLSVKEIWADGDGTLAAPTDGIGVSRRWQVHTTGKSVQLLDIQSDPVYLASDIPKSYGTPHPGNSFYNCRSVQWSHPYANCWIAVASYSMAPFSPEEREKIQQPNPLGRLPKYNISGSHIQRYYSKDVNGKKYLSSAGEPFPARPRNVSVRVVRVRMNVDQWQESWYDFDDTVNQSAVYIWDGNKHLVIPAKKGKLSGPDIGDLAEENGVKYYPLSCEIQVIRNGDDSWQEKIVDSGFNYKDSTNSDTITRIQVWNKETGTWENCVTEQLLDGNGQPLYFGGIYDPEAEPVELEFDEFDEKNWSALPFFSPGP